MTHSFTRQRAAGVLTLGLLGGCGTVAGPIKPLNQGESLISGSAEFSLSSLFAASYRYGLSNQMDFAIQAGFLGIGGDVRFHPYRTPERSITLGIGAVTSVLEDVWIQVPLTYNLHASDHHVRLGPYLAFGRDALDGHGLRLHEESTLLGVTAGFGSEDGAIDIRYGWPMAGSKSASRDVNFRGALYLNRLFKRR